MRIELQALAEPSRRMMVLSPVIAIALTLAFGAALFTALGIDPLRGLYVYFIQPLSDPYSLQELAVKATPLILIGVGLSVCFTANIWNIGAEGQYIFGAICGSWVALTLHDVDAFWVYPLMLAFGIAGGMAWGAIPAILKTRFNANEILTSLMLSYVAGLLLDYLVRGPWRDPGGFNFPESRLFSDAATMPLLIADGRVHLGFIFALVAVVVLAVMMGRSLKGFEVRVVGQAPRAARFAGFSEKKMVFFALMLSGGLAGLAGIGEVAGPIGQLLPVISPGYGFTAIIVAFLGRLNPVGVVFAGFLLSLSYVGGEAAQIKLGLPFDVVGVFQGVLLFFVLACDTMINYRVRLLPAGGRAREAG